MAFAAHGSLRCGLLFLIIRTSAVMTTSSGAISPSTKYPQRGRYDSLSDQVVFLTRNSVAVAHVVAQCTNRCTRRKVIVNAQPPSRKPKMKKICCYENRKTTRRTSARGTSSSGEHREGERNEGRAEWLRIRREQSSHPDRERIRVHSYPVSLLRSPP